MNGFEFSVEDAAKDVELQLDVAKILMRVVADVVLFDRRFVILEANLVGEPACSELVAGEEDQVLVVRRWFDELSAVALGP